MNRRLVPDPICDPHCGRGTHERIGFTVGNESWDVKWGCYDIFGTPAFWIDQTARGGWQDRVEAMAKGTDIESEVVFCLLGGFGVTAELARAAHQVVLELLAENPEAPSGEIEGILRQPLPGGRGRYRFPAQRSKRIAASLAHLRSNPPPEDPLELRLYLRELHGVGPKTAAWIVRNLTGSAQVAIVDIWLIRAMTSTGVFKSEWRVERHYDRFEEAFLQYAAHGNVQPGALDLCIWEEARIVGPDYFSSGGTI